MPGAGAAGSPQSDEPASERPADILAESDTDAEREAALLDAYWQASPQQQAQFRQHHPELAELFDCLDALRQWRTAVLDEAAGQAVKDSPSPAAAALSPAEPAQADSPPAATVGCDEAIANRPGEVVRRRFGRYELLEEIGRGGMGVVYRARQVELNRMVAVKMILSGYLADAEQIRRFQREAQIAARIRHPHIVSVFDYGQAEGHHYFAMDYVPGQSLQSLLQTGPLPIEQAARLIATIARAVAHLHQHGIVHRDLKPSNVLLDKQGVPYVSDFGLAKWLQGTESRTVSGAVLGTPSYMAPEQAEGRASAITPRTDVYSLGAILYALLTGRPPFVGDSPVEIVLQVLESEPPALRALRPEVPRDLELICLKCLEKDPRQRYATACELAEDLERYLQGELPSAAPYSWWQQLRRWFRREPAFSLHLLGLAVVALILQFNYWVNRILSPSLHASIMALLGVWFVLVLALRGLNRTRYGPDFLPPCWCLLDVAMLTAILWLAEDQLTPLVVGYPAIIVGSGLWGRRSLIRLSTAAVVLAYTLLILDYAGRLGGLELLPRPHHHLLFVVLVLLISGATSWQVGRIQALNRYYRIEQGTHHEDAKAQT